MSNIVLCVFFQSLMTGLMFHKPDDHFDFLIECLHKAKDSGGMNAVHWNAFVDFKRTGAPLPPISPTKQKSATDDIDQGRNRT